MEHLETVTAGHGGASRLEILRFEARQLIPGEKQELLVETEERYRDDGAPEDERISRKLTLCRQAKEWQCSSIPVALYLIEDGETTDWAVDWRIRKGRLVLKQKKGTLPPDIERLNGRDLEKLISSDDEPPDVD